MGLEILGSNEIMIKVIGLLGGKPWDRHDKKQSNSSKLSFFNNYNEYEYDKNRVKRILLEPWDEVAYHVLKFITCEGRKSILYAYHFRFLNQLRNINWLKPQ